jgi:hypothetical protein
MKAIKLILYCYRMQFSLIDSEPLIKKFLDREEKVKSDKEGNRQRDEEISRREKALGDHFKNEKLTQEKIRKIRSPNVVKYIGRIE